MGGWGAEWQSPGEGYDEQAAAQQAAALTQDRMRMSPFERRLLEAVEHLTAVVGARRPASPMCPQCGAEQPIAHGTAGAAAGGTGSAEPVDRAGPGSARPRCPAPQMYENVARRLGDLATTQSSSSTDR